MHEATARYYGEKVRRFGATPAGADWRCGPTQQMRFVQLLKVCTGASHYSLNDLGCGWGALLQFLARRRMRSRVDYLGVDLSQDMIAAARAARPQDARCFVVGARSPRVADYGVASGVFNVRLDVPIAQWEAFVRHTLRTLRDSSRRGFAVNFMEPVPEGIASPPELYRVSAERWATFIEDELGCNVEVVRGYGMREATLLARAADQAPPRSRRGRPPPNSARARASGAS